MTLFWLVYTPLLLAAVAFFGWSVYRYVRSRRRGRNARAPEVHLPAGSIPAELIALRAQFIVAPKQARAEAAALLMQRGAGDKERAVPDQTLPDDCEALLELLSRTRPSLPAR